MRIRKNVSQGLELILLGKICSYTEADAAAIFFALCGLCMLFGRRKDVTKWSESRHIMESPQTSISIHGIAETSIY